MAQPPPINDNQEFDLGDLIDGFALGPDAMELEVDAMLSSQSKQRVAGRVARCVLSPKWNPPGKERD